MKRTVPVESASAFIDAKINELGDWRGKTLAKARAIIHKADPEIVEEWKWRGTPIFSHGGIVCTGETYKNAVKLTFAKGAALGDPSGLFNSSLDGNVRRAIDIREGEKVDEAALKGPDPRCSGAQSRAQGSQEQAATASEQQAGRLEHLPWFRLSREWRAGAFSSGENAHRWEPIPASFRSDVHRGAGSFPVDPERAAASGLVKGDGEAW